MFKKLFGGADKPAKPVQVTGTKSTATTVDAIQKLGETEELLVKKRCVWGVGALGVGIVGGRVQSVLRSSGIVGQAG